MANATIFMIEDGQFGLAPVDKAAAGYNDAWQAPGGKEVDEVALADYNTGAVVWTCQVTSGALNATPDTTTTDTPATFCQAATSVPTPAETSYEVALSFLQDPNVKEGLNRFTFQYDTEEAYWYLGLDSGNPPRAIGRLRVQAATIGGDARTSLTADLTLPVSRKPDVEFGTAASSVIIKGDGTVVQSVEATLTTVAPNTGAAAGGTAVTLTGTNLTGATGVQFGGVAGTAFSVVNATTINVTTPAHAAGVVDVVVVHPGGNATKTGGFTYT